eukprot:79150_1
MDEKERSILQTVETKVQKPISSVQLFNMLQNKFNAKYKIIDIRSEKEWNDYHIWNSIKWPNQCNKQILKQFKIIVCGNSLGSACDKISKYANSIKYFTDIQEFHDKFPFLCTHNNIKLKGMNSESATYPNMVIE